MAVDAGYSFCHVKDFYEAIELNKFRTPDFTVITHWHYDHTFGMHAIKGVSIAHDKTNEFLKEQQKQAQNKFRTPDFTVITHWHYDHTFGMHAIKGVSIAHDKTNEFLKEQQKQAQSLY